MKKARAFWGVGLRDQTVYGDSRLVRYGRQIVTRLWWLRCETCVGNICSHTSLLRRACLGKDVVGVAR